MRVNSFAKWFLSGALAVSSCVGLQSGCLEKRVGEKTSSALADRKSRLKVYETINLTDGSRVERVTNNDIVEDAWCSLDGNLFYTAGYSKNIMVADSSGERELCEANVSVNQNGLYGVSSADGTKRGIVYDGLGHTRGKDGENEIFYRVYYQPIKEENGRAVLDGEAKVIMDYGSHLPYSAPNLDMINRMRLVGCKQTENGAKVYVADPEDRMNFCVNLEGVFEKIDKIPQEVVESRRASQIRAGKLEEYIPKSLARFGSSPEYVSLFLNGRTELYHVTPKSSGEDKK